MSYPHITAKIIADSLISRGRRITTFELTYPRYIHAEIMTHRQLSRNAQSSRAIPVARRLERVTADPVMPIRWGANKRGMQAKDEEVEKPDECEKTWRRCAEISSGYAEGLMSLGLHKQWANRLLEPFDTITVIATGTDWGNLFGLRCHPDAQPEFQYLAWKMADLYHYHTHELTDDLAAKRNLDELPPLPSRLAAGQWHLPYIGNGEQLAVMAAFDDMDEAMALLLKGSVGRCARVSYLNHDGSDPDIEKDAALHDRLLKDGHMSPFEHQARQWDAATDDDTPADLCGNFSMGFVQYRKVLPLPEVRTFNYLEAMKSR